MQCPQCQHENAPDAKFCNECGTPLASRCPACETENPPGAKFCKECGTSLTAPASSSGFVQTSAHPTTWQDQPSQAESPPIKPPSPDAERRQLTVMFCDLVDSTVLAGQLDPEDLRDVVRAYQKVCSEVIQRYDGHVAQLLGDGLLVYFGYPQAHEDDAQRAVRAGLGIVEAIGKLNTRLERAKGLRLAVRIGIHTGLVVVGEMGGEGRQEQLALGEVPNVASRIQGLAEPDTVIISDATFHLVEGYFTCQALGSHMLKGVAESVHVYRVFQESGAQSRLDITSARGLTPLVGREAEVTLLLERWNQAKDGQGQVVLLSGEGGIGKSRLVQVLKDHVAEESHTRLECRSSPYSQNTALYPMTDLLERTLRFQRDDGPEVKLEKFEQILRQYRLPMEESVPLFAPLLSLTIPEDRYPPLALSPQHQRQKTLESIVTLLLEQAEQQPVLFILEDLHWTDPTSLELLNLLIDQTPTSSICALLTCRPTFQPTWSSRSYLTQMTLNRLSRSQIEGMAEQVAGGKRLPAEVLQQIIEKSDGMPLFVEEITKAVLESGTLKDVNGQYEIVGSLAALAIPATLQDSLMARLDRLVTAKAVAQYAAVIGRQFSYELLYAVSQVDEITLQRELGRLVAAELVYQRGVPPQATYLFKHALVVDAAYQSLLKSTRQAYHQRIVQVLEGHFPETIETQPELLAQHATAAGLNAQAVAYWRQAVEHASQRSANSEVVAHLRKGLEVLSTLPDTPERAQNELHMQVTLSTNLMVTRGWASSELELPLTRARQLCELMRDRSDRFRVILIGLYAFYLVRAQYRSARELGEELLSAPERQHDAEFPLAGHQALGQCLFLLGEFTVARDHLEQGIAIYDPEQHRAHGSGGQDLGVSCLSWIPKVLWVLGYPEQAWQRNQEALSLAEELRHLPSLARGSELAARLHQFRREAPLVQEQAEAAIALATERGFAYVRAGATVLRGWAVAMQGQAAEGLAQMQEGLAAIRRTGAEVLRPYYLALLADVYGHIKQPEEGLRILAEALETAHNHEERFYEVELYRLKGELLLQQAIPDTTQAEACFQQALAIARHQHAKSLELRAATSLARLWQSQDKRKDASDLLAPVCNWFTEGFDTADLQEAKALLAALEG